MSHVDVAGSDGDRQVWGRVIGQPAAVRTLRVALAADELAHAWLVVGPRGVGQEELARALAAVLNCPTPPAPDEACGTCGTCVRIARGVHPSTVDLVPDGATHLVASVRGEWIREATRTLTEGRRKVLRVTAADRMTEATQNAFLKILEEPPPSVVWLLEVEDEASLLDTVSSRCRRLPVVPWGPAALDAEAGRLGIPGPARAAAVRVALGSPERLTALADPAVAQARRRHLGIVDRLASGGPGQVVPLAKELASWGRERSAAVKDEHERELVGLMEAFGVDERGRGWPPGMKTRIEKRHTRVQREEQQRALGFVLDDLASYLRDLLCVQAGGHDDAIVNLDAQDELRRDAGRLPPAAAVAGLRAVATCRAALDRNGSPELQLERLLLAVALPIYAAA